MVSFASELFYLEKGLIPLPRTRGYSVPPVLGLTFDANHSESGRGQAKPRREEGGDFDDGDASLAKRHGTRASSSDPSPPLPLSGAAAGGGGSATASKASTNLDEDMDALD